jgi:hypothetical protein
MTNIIKCTIKKSISISIKLLKWGTIIGIILAAIAGVGYALWSTRDIIGSGWETVVSAWNMYASWNFSYLAQIGALLAGIPWYVWIIIAIPSTIIGYSYLWCWTRQNPNKIRNFCNRHDESIAFLIVGTVIGICLQIFYVQYLPLFAGLSFGFIGMLCSEWDNR